MTAGSWFYRFMALTDYMNKLALNVPSRIRSGCGRSCPRRTWKPMPTCSSGWRRWCWRPKPRPARGAPAPAAIPKTACSTMSRITCCGPPLEWILQTLVGKTHPLFAIAWLGHALLATILGALAAAGAIGAAKYIATKSGAGRVASALGGLADTLTGGGQTGGGFTMLNLVLGMMLLALLGFALMAAIYIPWCLSSSGRSRA